MLYRAEILECNLAFTLRIHFMIKEHYTALTRIFWKHKSLPTFQDQEALYILSRSVRDHGARNYWLLIESIVAHRPVANGGAHLLSIVEVDDAANFRT